MKRLLAVAPTVPTSWAFEKDEIGHAQAGFEFTTAKRTPARQGQVTRDGTQKILAQHHQYKTGYRFATALVKGSSFKDLDLCLKGKPVFGDGDQAVGLVWRYRDESDDYVARDSVTTFDEFSAEELK